jgi:predicted branched-subunit amino acid permease
VTGSGGGRLTEAQRAVRRQALSVAGATSVYGISLGALGVSSGLTVWQTCLTSLLLFSGGSQFALVGVIGGGGSAGSAIAASSLLGIRNAFYAVQLNSMLRPRGLRRVPAAQLTIDESTAVAVVQPDLGLASRGFWTTGIAIYVCWNLTTLCGALVGNALGDPRNYGLDAAASGAFLALLWPRLKDRRTVGMALAAALVAVVLVPVIPVGLPVVAAAGVAVVVGATRPQQPPPETGGEGAGP